MTPRTEVVGRYIEGFRRTDRKLTLSCLVDDVVWELHGYEIVTDTVIAVGPWT